ALGRHAGAARRHRRGGRQARSGRARGGDHPAARRSAARRAPRRRRPHPRPRAVRHDSLRRRDARLVARPVPRARLMLAPLKKLARAALGQSSPLVLARLASAALTFGLPLALVRLLDPEAFGRYKQFFLAAQTVLLVGQLGLTQSLYYFLPRGG